MSLRFIILFVIFLIIDNDVVVTDCLFFSIEI